MTDETRTVTRDQMRQALIESDLIPRYREYSLLSPSMNPAETVEHLAALWGDAIFAALPAAITGEGLSAPLDVLHRAIIKEAEAHIRGLMNVVPSWKGEWFGASDWLRELPARLAATPQVGEER